MERMKKFYEEHKQEAIAAGFGTLLGIAGGLAYVIHRMSQEQIDAGEVWTSDDGASLLVLGNKNGIVKILHKQAA